MSDRPTKAPLRKIVERHKPKGWYGRRRPERQRVTLECGHDSDIPYGAPSMRTRCYGCLREEQAAWEGEHTCAHGVLVVDGRVCKDCEIERLRAALLKYGGHERRCLRAPDSTMTVLSGPPPTCDCGWEALYRELAGGS